MFLMALSTPCPENGFLGPRSIPSRHCLELRCHTRKLISGWLSSHPLTRYHTPRRSQCLYDDNFLLFTGCDLTESPLAAQNHRPQGIMMPQESRARRLICWSVCLTGSPVPTRDAPYLGRAGWITSSIMHNKQSQLGSFRGGLSGGAFISPSLMAFFITSLDFSLAPSRGLVALFGLHPVVAKSETAMNNLQDEIVRVGTDWNTLHTRVPCAPRRCANWKGRLER